MTAENCNHDSGKIILVSDQAKKKYTKTQCNLLFCQLTFSIMLPIKPYTLFAFVKQNYLYFYQTQLESVIQYGCWSINT